MNSWKSIIPSPLLSTSFKSLPIASAPATSATSSLFKTCLSSSCEILPSPFLSKSRKADQHTSSWDIIAYQE